MPKPQRKNTRKKEAIKAASKKNVFKASPADESSVRVTRSGSSSSSAPLQTSLNMLPAAAIPEEVAADEEEEEESEEGDEGEKRGEASSSDSASKETQQKEKKNSKNSKKMAEQEEETEDDEEEEHHGPDQITLLSCVAELGITNDKAASAIAFAVKLRVTNDTVRRSSNFICYSSLKYINQLSPLFISSLGKVSEDS